MSESKGVHTPRSACYARLCSYYSAVRALPAEIANSISAIYLRKIGGNTNLILNSD